MAEPRARRLVGRERALEHAVAALRPGRGVLVDLPSRTGTDGVRRGAGGDSRWSRRPRCRVGHGDRVAQRGRVRGVRCPGRRSRHPARSRRRDRPDRVGVAQRRRCRRHAARDRRRPPARRFLGRRGRAGARQPVGLAGADRSRGLPASGEPREAVPGRVPHPHRPRRAVAAGHGRRRGGSRWAGRSPWRRQSCCGTGRGAFRRCWPRSSSAASPTERSGFEAAGGGGTAIPTCSPTSRSTNEAPRQPPTAVRSASPSTSLRSRSRSTSSSSNASSASSSSSSWNGPDSSRRVAARPPSCAAGRRSSGCVAGRR